MHMPVGISSPALETPGGLWLGSHLPNLGEQGGRPSVYIFNFSKVYEAEVGVGEVHLLQRVRMTKRMVSRHFQMTRLPLR